MSRHLKKRKSSRKSSGTRNVTLMRKSLEIVKSVPKPSGIRKMEPFSLEQIDIDELDCSSDPMQLLTDRSDHWLLARHVCDETKAGVITDFLVMIAADTDTKESAHPPLFCPLCKKKTGVETTGRYCFHKEKSLGTLLFNHDAVVFMLCKDCSQSRRGFTNFVTRIKRKDLSKDREIFCPLCKSQAKRVSGLYFKKVKKCSCCSPSENDNQCSPAKPEDSPPSKAEDS